MNWDNLSEKERFEWLRRQQFNAHACDHYSQLKWADLPGDIQRILTHG